jgi:TRAP-type uncharacterized transport system substrate-binding protein
MNKTFFSKGIILAAAMSMAACLAQAQALKVSTGSPSGTYSRMFRELNTVCGPQVAMQESNSSGATQNIDRIVGNEVNSAIVQTDVLFFRGRTEDLGNVKTIVALAPEEIHVVALAQSLQKEGGTLGFGAKPIQLNTVNDLRGRKVVAAGGSYITAQVIRLQSEIDFMVEEVATGEAALAAVASGYAQAAILVGGAPLGAPAVTNGIPTLIAALDRNYKLLPFGKDSITKLKNVYRPANVNYPKMGAAGVETIATDALFVSREYKSPRSIESLAKLRSCFNTNLVDVQEQLGTHPAWQKVVGGNQGKWPFMTLPVKK